MKKFIFLALILSLSVVAHAELITGQIVNIKVYDPPIHIDRKHMHEVWLVKITIVNPVTGKYRLYETLNTKNVQDYKIGDIITWDVDFFGDRDVRGCVEDMQP